jgi:hypothetical protein
VGGRGGGGGRASEAAAPPAGCQGRRLSGAGAGLAAAAHERATRSSRPPARCWPGTRQRPPHRRCPRRGHAAAAGRTASSQQPAARP